jgi:hypothetical protein
MSDPTVPRRTVIRGGALLTAAGLAGCLGDDSLPTATPAGSPEGIDLFFRNSFVKDGEDGDRLQAQVRVGVTAVGSGGDIDAITGDEYRLDPETTRMVPDVFTPDPERNEYVVTAETIPVADATQSMRKQLRFEPGGSDAPSDGVVTITVSNDTDTRPGPDPKHQLIEIDA